MIVRMYNLQSHEKRIFYLTGGIVAAWVLIIGLLIYPRYLAITKINREITEMRQQLELKYEKTKRLHKSQINLASAQALVLQNDELFLKKGDELGLIVALEALADKHRLEQKINLGSAPRSVKPGLAAFDLNVSVAGGFVGLLDYFYDLENVFLPVVAVSDFNFGNDRNVLRQSGAVSGRLNLNFNAEVYVRD